MLNVFNLSEWCFNRLTDAQSFQFEIFVNTLAVTLLTSPTLPLEGL